MLAYLTVRDFALVEDLELRFVDGLTVITGESGAGKSILLDALALVLGQRASKSQIRPDARDCEVCAEFDLQHATAARQVLEAQALLDDDEPSRCLVRRVATSEGRSRAWINGSAVSLGVLRDLCGALVAIHDQFAQQQLLGPASQRAWLDDFISDSTVHDDVKRHYQEWRKQERHFAELQRQSDEAQARRELLEYQVNELDEFQLQDGEFEELSSRFKRLNQAQEIMGVIRQTLEDLERNHAPGLGRAKSELDRIDDTSPELVAARELLEGVEVGVDESLRQLRSYGEALTADEGLDEVTPRLDRIHELARKHRVASHELYRKTQELSEELKTLQAFERDLPSAETTLANSREHFYEAAQQLTAQRAKAAKPFANAVKKTLSAIGMAKAKFEVEFSDALGEFGVENVEFKISVNTKYAPGPLKDIASGGELARVSLAILAVVASHSKLPCLVLDEADVGVGGTTADEIGRMLRRLAAYTQVVCVTHAPQVAALGDSQLRVLKTPTQDIAANEVTGEERVEEIARMVAGQKINAESRKYASVLLQEAQSRNQSRSIAS